MRTFIRANADEEQIFAIKKAMTHCTDEIRTEIETATDLPEDVQIQIKTGPLTDDIKVRPVTVTRQTNGVFLQKTVLV